MSDNETPNKALLKVEFSASGIGLNIRDPQAEKDYAERHGIDPKRIRFTKKILEDAVKPITSEVGKIRRFINKNTFEGIGSSRIVVPSDVDRIRRQVNKHVAAAIQALEELVSRWPAIIQKERDDLNGDFDPDNYPESPEALRSLFSFSFSVEPMPDPNQFRLIQELTDTERESMALQLEAQIAAARNQMQSDVTRRTLDLIKEVADTLGDPNKKIIDGDGRKGCVPKLREHLERLPLLNIEGNPQLAALRTEALAALELTAENLRNNSGARNRTAYMAGNLHKKFSAAGFGERKII